MDERQRKAAEQFILDQIDTVPHLEALLLLWNNRPQEWNLEDLARALYLDPEPIKLVAADLERRGLITVGPHSRLAYHSGEWDSQIEMVDSIYRREVVRISNMIHSKPSASLREFARAFRLRKERD